jgi:hypothetical protein
MFVYAAYQQTENGGSVLVPIYGGSLCSGTRRSADLEDEAKEVDMLNTVSNASLQVGMPATGGATHDATVMLIMAGMCLAGGFVARRYLSR